MNTLKKIYRFYADGFRNMRLGRILWLVVLVKLFIIFAVLKLFFFPDHIGENAEKGHEAEFVADEILK
ncbi:DUF4492 domain-containing protein [Prevotella sp. P2-180]|uniref:DUF4492 domain-containing protein n=1 Tax=Prevotella sp. P2-180 TaxID=2024224 RepID=UPI000B965552|nr:DUF4492 domain-containing protein [Prevotella sp. P2-180]MCI6338337.1 DUF4492 domain-containing protein [Prevotella sp.]MCI7090240.1 DUF4492 domain-containing protein [Prevotella sp.]MCI7257092.1 DUF4492 domain-containing protein [Prevotella sp.]MDD5784905.1 DUF4492 domain-containing protein [Prevotella sp.]MDD7226106.1 DUF4492 domain-containing protein [Prevotella sp.]